VYIIYPKAFRDATKKGKSSSGAEFFCFLEYQKFIEGFQNFVALDKDPC